MFQLALVIFAILAEAQKLGNHRTLYILQWIIGFNIGRGQLGRLYLFGADELEKDKEKAVEWLTKSANDGNEYVQNMLNNIDDFENMLLRNTVMGLFVNLSRCIEDNYSQKQCSLKIQTDRKLRKVIQKRKSGIGIREEQNMTN